MSPYGDNGTYARGERVPSGPGEWMTVAEMQEYMHAGRTKAYELIKAGEARSYVQAGEEDPREQAVS